MSRERHQDSLSAACTDVGMKRDLFLENGISVVYVWIGVLDSLYMWKKEDIKGKIQERMLASLAARCIKERRPSVLYKPSKLTIISI